MSDGYRVGGLRELEASQRQVLTSLLEALTSVVSIVPLGCGAGGGVDGGDGMEEVF